MSHLLALQSCLMLVSLAALQTGQNKNSEKEIRYLPPSEMVQRLSVTWEKPYRSIDLNRPGGKPVLIIPFSITVTNWDGSKKEVDWFQPVEIVMVREPVKKLDLQKPVDKKDVCCFALTLNSQDKSRGGLTSRCARFDAAALNCPLGENADFQCLIHLYEFSWPWFADEKKAMCKHIIADSVTTLSLPGPPKMDDTLIAINRCPTLYSEDVINPVEPFNPMNVLKAVNPLIRLGKEKAIQKLQQYNDLAGCEVTRKYVRAESRDTATRWCMSVIAETIFEDSKFRDPRTKDWRSIVVSEGIPFRTKLSAFWGNKECDLTKYLGQMLREGKILSNELTPPANPLRVAESLYAKLKSNDPKRKRLDKLLHSMLREQAWLMVKQHFPESTNSTDPDNSDDALWNERIKLIDAKRLKWNPERNEYEVTAK